MMAPFIDCITPLMIRFADSFTAGLSALTFPDRDQKYADGEKLPARRHFGVSRAVKRTPLCTPGKGFEQLDVAVLHWG